MSRALRFESMIDPGDVVNTRQVTLSLDLVRAELLAWTDYNGAANLRLDHVLDLLSQVSLPFPAQVPSAPDDGGGCLDTPTTCTDRYCRHDPRDYGDPRDASDSWEPRDDYDPEHADDEHRDLKDDE